MQTRRDLFAEAMRAIDAECDKDLSLASLAERTLSSPRQLQRVFEEVGETTFRASLTGVRMDRAARLLATESLSVRTVALRVGYRQPAQFAKAFRRHHGTAPAEFRARAHARAARPRTSTVTT